MEDIIDTGSYKIFIGNMIFAELRNFISASAYSKLFILADENTYIHCFPLVKNSFAGFSHQIIIIKSGEGNKNLETCSYVWQQLIEAGADRKSLFINLGGGVIGDLGGFVASTYKRGIDFINIPTTVLAQVDASVGGKLGVDFNSLKNIIGLFANPKAVFIYPGFSDTLPDRQVLSGFAEIIKHGLIYDREYWQHIRSNAGNYQKILPELISKSVAIKNDVVSKDPFEKGLRKILNFGHTIGHAIETWSLLNDTEPLLHGEAVAIGMICEAYLSFRITGLGEAELTEAVEFIRSRYPRYAFTEDRVEEFLELMKYDKKNEKNKINFSLLSAIGNCEINAGCDDSLIREALSYYLQHLP